MGWHRFVVVVISMVVLMLIGETASFPSVRICDPSCGRGTAYVWGVLAVTVGCVVVGTMLMRAAGVGGDG